MIWSGNIWPWVDQRLQPSLIQFDRNLSPAILSQRHGAKGVKRSLCVILPHTQWQPSTRPGQDSFTVHRKSVFWKTKMKPFLKGCDHTKTNFSQIKTKVSVKISTLVIYQSFGTHINIGIALSSDGAQWRTITSLSRSVRCVRGNPFSQSWTHFQKNNVFDRCAYKWETQFDQKN